MQKMQKIRKIQQKSRLIISLLVIEILLSGCSTHHEIQEENNIFDAADKKEISIVSKPTELTFVFAEGDETGKSAMIDMVNRFNEKYENITVNIRSSGNGSYDEILKTLESVGEFPDILEVTNAAAYLRAGLL
ncbi:MAG: carbohydrate ABC transporter substrate-binding protein, partial [Agathobacter sp.]